MVGKVLAQYQISEKLGEGGMGVVWKARDTHLERLAALKTTVVNVEDVVERVRKELKQRKSAQADPIDVIGPVDQQSAPDHDREQREVDPVEPANCGWVFGFEPFHAGALHARCLIRSRGYKSYGSHGCLHG